MINPKLTALVVTMSLLGAATPAAFAQLPPGLVVIAPDANQTVTTSTGGNTQFNVGSQNQEAANNINIVSEASADGKKSKAKAETEVEDSTINAVIGQTQTQTQANVMEDNDTVEVDAQNAAAGAIAANVNIEGVLIDILGGGGGAHPSPP